MSELGYAFDFLSFPSLPFVLLTQKKTTQTICIPLNQHKDELKKALAGMFCLYQIKLCYLSIPNDISLAILYILVI